MDPKPPESGQENANPESANVPASAEPQSESLESPAPTESTQKPSADEVNALEGDLPQEAQNPLSNTQGLDQTPKESKTKVKGKFGGKKNIYVIGFVLLFMVAAGITAFSFMSSQKKPPVATIGNQALSQEALAQLANTDAAIGSSAKTLTVQSDSVFSGQVLIRGALTVASNLQVGGNLQAPELTISGTANLGTAQINRLQVATDTVVQGTSSLKDLNVAGSSSFNGPMTASQITVTKLILSGNSSLQVPNHISFPGATPGRSVNNAVLGAGGSANIGGSDTAGSISINTGGGPVAGCFVNVAFNQAFPSTPRVIVSPVGAGAGSLDYYVNRSTTGFSLCTNSVPPAGSAFGFDYFVVF